MIHAPVLTPSMQRSQGAAQVALSAGHPRARLRTLHQSGAARIMLPALDRVPEVVILNTGGGLAGGDRLSYAIDIGAGLTARATTQTAERAYRSTGATARVDLALTVGPDGWLDWLPQETILYQGARLHRSTRVDMAPGAGVLMTEMIVLGRAAMGEVVTDIALTDRREVWRAGRPVALDVLRLDTRALTTGAAGLAGARALAALWLVCDGAEDMAAPLRAAIPAAGVSALPGRLMLRAATPDAPALRALMRRALDTLRRDRTLPRVWQA
jgi:urease accessory protein